MTASFLFGTFSILRYSPDNPKTYKRSQEMGWRKLPDCLFALALGAALAWVSVPAIASIAVEPNQDNGSYLPIAGIIWFVTFALVYGELKPIAQFLKKDWFILWQIQDLGRELRANSQNLESPEYSEICRLADAVEDLSSLGPQGKRLRHLYRTVLPLLQNVAKSRWKLTQAEPIQLEDARQKLYSDMIVAEEGVKALRRTINIRGDGNDPDISP